MQLVSITRYRTAHVLIVDDEVIDVSDRTVAPLNRVLVKCRCAPQVDVIEGWFGVRNSRLLKPSVRERAPCLLP